MSPAPPSIRRLIGADVGRLLDEATAAASGLRVAVTGVDGSVVASSGGWSEDASAEIHSLELVPRDASMGTIRWWGDAPAPLLRVLQLSLRLLLLAALDTHDLARETLERYREINLLYRASESIGASLDASEVRRLLLAETERVIPFDTHALLLGGDEAGDGWQHASDLIASVRQTTRPDIGVWATAGAAGGLQSALCVPVRAAQNVLGVVVLGRLDGGRADGSAFTASDEKLLLGLASQAGVALERLRLHEQEAHRLRFEEELAIARRIQLTLLPAHPPDLPGWSFAAAYQAAREVGGDFYDFLDSAVSQGRMGLVVADVTGKGVPAALMMAYSRAILRAESTTGKPPPEVLANTNRLIMQDRQSRLFLSAFYAQLHLDSGRLAYANAGHDAPLWIKAETKNCVELAGHGAILGAFNDLGLELHEVDLAEGDSVVFYTDGVTEARDPAGGLFGDDLLAAAAVEGAAADGGAQSIVDSIICAVDDFTAGAEQADDLTIVVVQRAGG